MVGPRLCKVNKAPRVHLTERRNVKEKGPHHKDTRDRQGGRIRNWTREDKERENPDDRDEIGGREKGGD